MEIHQLSLSRLCRVCGLLLTKPKKVPRGYKCTDFQALLRDAFKINVTDDNESTHPTHFCQSCRGVLYCQERAQTNNEEYQQARLRVFNWTEHKPECQVCSHMSEIKKGGRPRKTARPGRPRKQSPRSAIQHLKSIAPKSLTDTSKVDLTQADLSSDLTCTICLNIVDQPIVLETCSSLVCTECCCKWLRQSDVLSCPCCYGSHLEDFTTIKTVEPLTLKLLASQTVQCTVCLQHMKLEQHSEHYCQKNLIAPSTQHSPSTSIQEVLAKNSDTPLTTLEHKLQTSLVKRSLSGSSNATIQLKTGGQVSQSIHICKNVPTHPHTPNSRSRFCK